MNRRDFLKGIAIVPALAGLVKKAIEQEIIEIELEDELEAWDGLSDEVTWQWFAPVNTDGASGKLVVSDDSPTWITYTDNSTKGYWVESGGQVDES